MGLAEAVAPCKEDVAGLCSDLPMVTAEEEAITHEVAGRLRGLVEEGILHKDEGVDRRLWSGTATRIPRVGLLHSRKDALGSLSSY